MLTDRTEALFGVALVAMRDTDALHRQAWEARWGCCDAAAARAIDADTVHAVEYDLACWDAVLVSWGRDLLDRAGAELDTVDVDGTTRRARITAIVDEAMARLVATEGDR